jgi:PAS domain S-box-containing protein
MAVEKPQGFALIADPARIIISLLYSSDPGFLNQSNQADLADWVDEGSQEKLGRFLSSVHDLGSADGWEVIMIHPDNLKPVQLFGFYQNKSMLIIGAPDAGNADMIRQLLLEDKNLPAEWDSQLGKPIRAQPGAYTNQQSINDISALNNEIIVLQRELFKKQTQLEQMNAAIKQYSINLEEMVADRTRELQASEAKFRGIFEASSLGISIITRDGAILTANQALLNMIGCTADDACQQKITDVFYVSSKDEFERIFHQLQESPEKSRRLEKQFTRSDGSARWAELVFFLIQPGKDQPALAINIIEDTTEKRATQQALIQSEKLSAVGKIAASLAHEINNPLQAVMGNLGLAQESLTENPEVEKYIRIAASELKRVSQIVADLREASRKPTVKERSATPIEEIIQRVVDLTHKKCEEKKITLTWKKEPKTPMVLVSADQMVQVMLNLVINAIEAMPDGGELSIISEDTTDPKGVNVFVSDNGGGIADEIRPRLFEPFFSTKQEGMGLGLYISRQIIKNHQGRLEIERSNPGGTTFRIWLPTDNKPDSG